MKMLTQENDSQFDEEKNTKQRRMKWNVIKKEKKKKTSTSKNSNNSDEVIIAHELLHKCIYIFFDAVFMPRLTD